jgi:hypothetical protein
LKGALLAVVAAAAVGAALAACDTVDLGAPPADINACRPSQQYFIDAIWPTVLAADYGGRHCYDGGCHDLSAAAFRSLVLVQPSGPGVIPLPMDWAANYKAASEQMSCSNVDASALYLLPSGIQPHGGGMLFKPDDPQALAIKMWVAAP